MKKSSGLSRFSLLIASSVSGVFGGLIKHFLQRLILAGGDVSELSQLIGGKRVA